MIDRILTEVVSDFLYRLNVLVELIQITRHLYAIYAFALT